MNKSKWFDYESWKQYGLEKRFDERNSTSLKNSKKMEERSWYYFGVHKKMIRSFEFNKIRDKNFTFNNYKEWEQYGINEGFDEMYPVDIINSENKNYRSWYKKGSKSSG